MCVFVCVLGQNSAASVAKEQGRKCVVVSGVYILSEKLYLSSCCLPALNPFEEQENVDARFVEETALKQTLILLGFEEK